MRARLVLISILSLTFSSAAVAQEPVRVPLDETGIADWRFLNPLKAQDLGAGDLEFVNTTGDRTFVVSIDYQSEVLGSAFLSSRLERGRRRSLRELVCHVLGSECTPSYAEKLEALEALKGFQEVVRRTPPGKSADCDVSQFFSQSTACGACDKACTDSCIAAQPIESDRPSASDFNLTCQLEKLFWKSACNVDPATVAALGTRSGVGAALQSALELEAAFFVAWLFRYPDDPEKPDFSRCSGECAWCRRNEFEPRKPPEGNPDFVAIVAKEAEAAAKQEFETRHLEVARATLISALDKKAEQIMTDLAGVETVFEARRRELDKRIDFTGSDRDLVARCLMRELEAAARLLASHSHTSVLPFELPEDIAEGQWCYDPDPGRGAAIRARGGVMEAESVTTGRMKNTEARLMTPTAVDLLDCNLKDGKRTCTATAVIPPNQRARFTRDLLNHHPSDVIRFRVVYYGDPEVPPNGAGAVARIRNAKPVDSGRSAFGFGIDTTSSYDLPATFQGHRRHTGASGALSFQYLGDTRLDFSTTIRFKQGDFGGPEASNQLSATQYQAKISFENRTSFQAGRMRFAQPSAGIAISESGEGLRGAFSWNDGSVNAAYIIRRESDAADNTADADDDDSDVYLLQYNPVISGVRSFLATALLGQEKKDRVVSAIADGVTKETVPRPYTYATFGVDARFGVARLPSAVLTVAGYHSVRNVRPHSGLIPDRGDCEPPYTVDQPCIKQAFGAPNVDGRGTVALLTFTTNGTTPRKITDPPAKSASAYAATVWLGAGSGNNPETADRDEGYLGETAGYANDVIFLSQISKASLYTEKVGRGLSNKFYLGTQYSDSRISPLEWVARAFDLNVESRSTTVSLHTYRFNKPVNESNYAGSELDLEFKAEVPKGVNWIMKTAFYQAGRAVERLAQTPLLENPWSVTFGVSISIDAK